MCMYIYIHIYIWLYFDARAYTSYTIYITLPSSWTPKASVRLLHDKVDVLPECKDAKVGARHQRAQNKILWLSPSPSPSLSLSLAFSVSFGLSFRRILLGSWWYHAPSVERLGHIDCQWFRLQGFGLGLSRVYPPGPDDISQSSSHAIAYRFQH